MGDWRDKLPEDARPARHEDDEGFDRIEIVAEPRYKMSGLSGDEWRVGAKIRFYRNGEVVAEEYRTRMKYAVRHLPWLFDRIPETASSPLYRPDPELCFQPGCSEPATSTYLIKQEYCTGGGNCGQERESFRPTYRRFCARHLQRGDCGLEDADHNYEIVDGPGPGGTAMLPDDESPSAFGGVVEIEEPTDD